MKHKVGTWTSWAPWRDKKRYKYHTAHAAQEASVRPNHQEAFELESSDPKEGSIGRNALVTIRLSRSTERTHGTIREALFA